MTELWGLAYPLDARGFESDRLNRMVLGLQPSIVVNNWSGMPGDFDAPEQNTNPGKRDCDRPRYF